jgi:predicted DNA-binding transcriptional regulator YafY
LSHDTDKLIRQLSLVAYLMAQRRALTARDVKTNVEGYSEMSDEAFARRFYSDRAELLALGVPLHSQRDEFTGEELYTLRSERYFLPPVQLRNEELAALQTAFSLLDGQFAYAEPLRLALQNLALGRPGPDEAPTRTAARVEVHDFDYAAPGMPAKLSKLEGAISKQRTVKFTYYSLKRDARAERTVNPYALLLDKGAWYVIGADLERDEIRTFRVLRIEGDIRFATRRERDFRLPADFDAESYRLPPDWQIGDIAGEARVELAGDTAWWALRSYGEYGRVEDGVFVTPYANLEELASWILRQDGRAVPAEPDELRRVVARGLRAVRELHEAAPPKVAREVPEELDAVSERVEGAVAPERFAILQALLAYLLDACGDDNEAVIPASELTERFQIPYESLDEHLQLLNLVNFGGGCYAVYAELEDDVVNVDKELYGDTFRAPPRLTPLEARAIRLALEYIGPMIAAEAHRPLDRVRKKLEETFGEFKLAQTPEPDVGSEEESLIGVLNQAVGEQRLVELEYQKENAESVTQHLVEPHHLERSLPHWYVHTWDRTRGGVRSFRVDRMRSAKLLDENFERRPDLELGGGRRPARILYRAGEAARRRLEKPSARLLANGDVLVADNVGEDWLVGEILGQRGEALLIEPEDLRKRIARHARELERELGLSRLRVSA